jgi:hypothetical protein
MILPKGMATLTRQRMAHLHLTAAKWSLYEFDQREDALAQMDTGDCGNMTTRLMHAVDEGLARDRFTESIARIRSILPLAEVVTLSPALMSFRLHGLEFAQARIVQDPRNFESKEEIAFGVGPEERVLGSENEMQFGDLVRLAAAVRHKDGPKNHKLWRMHSEGWLESLVFGNVAALDGRLRPEPLYAQVPAFAAADRAMIDVLTTTRDSRLAVIELKADEDLQLPLQGVDYWSRVAWHQSRGEFGQFGYFPGQEISPLKPLLILVAPALHVHPTTDTILRYLSPEIDWELLGIDERWREEIKVVFRKRAKRSPQRNAELAIPA